MAKKEIFSIKTIKEKRFHTLELESQYSSLMGNPEKKFTGMLYGASGSGKSVYALQFANYFAKNFDVDAGKLYVASGVSFERMCHYIEKNHYRLLLIDSVKYMEFTVSQLKELRTRFAKRQLCVLMVDFGLVKDKPASGVNLLHASDVKMFFRNGRVHCTSRYTNIPIEKQLFVPQTAKKQPMLFD